jgi:hypothetical protein
VYVVQSILAWIGPTLAIASEPQSTATPEAARATLHRLIETMINVLLGTEEATRWARFLVREQMYPTAAFEVIYGFMSGASGTAAQLLATVLARPVDENVRLTAFTLLGQVLVFRLAQALILRRMEWTTIGERERDAIKQVVHRNIDAILEGAKS